MQSRIGLSIAAFGVLLAALLPLGADAQTGPELEFESLDFGPVDAAPEPEPPVGFIERATQGGNYRLAKRSMPLHELVRGLLPQVGHTLTDIGELFLEDSLGVKKGTVQERALLTAIVAAIEVEPDNVERARRKHELIVLRTREGGDASRRRNREMMLEDARRIGVVWGGLVADLGPGSPEMTKISAYVEERRVGMSIVSSESFEDPDHMVWRMGRAFQAGVSSGLSNN